MKHTLKIGIGKPPVPGIVGYRKVTMRERFLRHLLGDRRTLTIIVPGESVTSLSVVEEGGENHEARPKGDY